MITSKKEYKEFLKADLIALTGKGNMELKFKIKQIIAPHQTLKFQRKLRKLEYFGSCRKDILGRGYYYYLKLSYRKISMKMGFSIPENVFGPGLAIVHYGSIVVNPKAIIGKNCRIHVCTNIGASGGASEAPQIGDNVYIGPGAKIYGNIKIGNNIAIGANSTVNKSFEENNIMIAGSPAKKIKNIDIGEIIKHVK